MMSRLITTMALFGIPALSLMSCLSSEETGAGDRAKTPVQILSPIDTAYRGPNHVVRRDTASIQRTDSAKPVAKKPPRSTPKFKSKQDTVKASVVTKLKSSVRTRMKIEHPEHPLYTVQIGAFSRASNALRAQKLAKERFADQPVFNNYVKSAKLYYVDVGRYENREDASALYDTMKQKFPKEYSRCLVNFIP